MKKGVGSISLRYGSGDPDPHQNVTDPPNTALTPIGWCCCPASSSPRRRHSSAHPESRIRGVQQDSTVVLIVII